MNIDSFPFSVTFVDGASYSSPEQMYRIAADFADPNLSSYKMLFDGCSSEELISLVDVVALIIEENSPNLFDHMDFDEEEYMLDMHVDSDWALQGFLALAGPVFRDLDLLTGYVHTVAAR